MTEYLYRLLPSGNADDFEWIAEELKKRGIEHEVSDLPTGGRMWRIPATEVNKFPTDENGPYFGNEEHGWSLSRAAKMWEKDRVEWGGTEWTKG